MTSIGVITCRFGQWPPWGDLFLESCRRNSTIDFIVVTDNPPAYRPRGGNVAFVHLDLQAFGRLAAERLGVETHLTTPYKVIDFKPAFATILQPFLGDQEFWGYCDQDLVFGDIRAFLTEATLGAHDVISARREFLSGHFTLLRRSLARLYERSRDWRRVFSSDTPLNFDECGWGLHFKLLRGQAFADVAAAAQVDSMMHVLARSPDIRVHFQTLCGEYLPMIDGRRSVAERLRWREGKLHDLASGRELMYYHLQYLKRTPGFHVPRWGSPPGSFLITRHGVLPCN